MGEIINKVYCNMENNLLKYIKTLASVTSGQQKEFFEAELANAKIVKCVPLCEVFTSEEINVIKNYVKPQKKECYKNAHLLCVWFPEKAQYVEGLTSCCGLGIDHAFNKIGDKYVDITMELCLKEDITAKEYLSIGEYNLNTINEVVLDTKYYGGIFREIFIKNLNSK